MNAFGESFCLLRKQVLNIIGHYVGLCPLRGGEDCWWNSIKLTLAEPFWPAAAGLG